MGKYKTERGRSRTRTDDSKRFRGESPEDDVALTITERRTAFIAERIAIPTGVNKNRRKQMVGTNLVYTKCDPKTRQGLDVTRKTRRANARGA